MKICDDGHDEVCYEERLCPACKLVADLEAAQSEIENLKEEITELEDQE